MQAYNICVLPMPQFGVMAQQSDTLFSVSNAHHLKTFSLVLTASSFVAVSFLLSWHFYLVLTAQGTIDFYDNCQSWREARRSGRVWKNPYHRGCIQNFKVIPLFSIFICHDLSFWFWRIWYPSLLRSIGQLHSYNLEIITAGPHCVQPGCVWCSWTLLVGIMDVAFVAAQERNWLRIYCD